MRRANGREPHLGSILRDARLGAGVSQQALARRSGVPQPAISRIERGAESPSFERFSYLTSCLGLRPSVVLEPMPYRGDRDLLLGDRQLAPAQRIESAFKTAAFLRALRAGTIAAERE